jgi:hydroxymethylpyrimidine pyrophosphatase-like HAD family hydrolase
MARFLALATDGDGTLTTRGHMSHATVSALQRWLQSSGRLILVTGESVENARSFSHGRLFHRIVAENGAILLDPATGEQRHLCQPRPENLLRELHARVNCMRGGKVIMMCQTAQRMAVERALRELGSDWQSVPNRRDLMVVPPGVSKATGLSAALEELQLSSSEVVAVGDAENDLPLIECCGLGVAVANAKPMLKHAAQLTLNHKAGRGVAELIERMLAGDLPEPHVRRACSTALDDGGMQWLAAACQPQTASH